MLQCVSIPAFRLGFWPDGNRQRKKVDEAFRIFGVIPSHGEARQVRAVQRERRNSLGDVEIALPQFQSDRSRDVLLRHIKKSIQRSAQRRKPQTVVNQFGITQRQRLLEGRRFAVDGVTLL